MFDLFYSNNYQFLILIIKQMQKSANTLQIFTNRSLAFTFFNKPYWLREADKNIPRGWGAHSCGLIILHKFHIPLCSWPPTPKTKIIASVVPWSMFFWVHKLSDPPEKAILLKEFATAPLKKYFLEEILLDPTTPPPKKNKK